MADDLIELFWDQAVDAFRTPGKDAQTLIASPIDTQDGALPSANSVAAAALLRLAALTGVDRYRDHADRVIGAMDAALAAAPVAFAGMVTAADLARRGLTEVVVTGDRPDLLETVRSRYLPGRRARVGRAVRLSALAGPHWARRRTGWGSCATTTPARHRPRERRTWRPSWMGPGTSIWVFGGIHR